MNDLDLLTAMGDETPLPALEDLAIPRARLVAAISSQPARSLAPRLRGKRTVVSRGMLIAGAAAAVAAAVAVTVAVPAGAPRKPAAQSGQSTVTPGTVQHAQLTAARVLDQAAAAALTQQTVIPRPDQFYYTKVSQVGGDLVESWYSVDGVHDGLTIAGGSKLVLPGCRPGQPCVPAPAYLPDMPVKASKMFAFLKSWLSPRTNHPVDLANPLVMQKVAEGLLLDEYLLPGQRAAFYQFLAARPGLTVIQGVHDVAGRPGVGVGLKSPRGLLIAVFDPKTFTFLGINVAGGGARSGSAMLKSAIVDGVGQR